MTILFGFATRVVLVRLKAPFDRLRSDDSILALVRIFGRFDGEAVRGALECLVCHAGPPCVLRIVGFQDKGGSSGLCTRMLRAVSYNGQLLGWIKSSDGVFQGINR